MQVSQKVIKPKPSPALAMGLLPVALVAYWGAFTVFKGLPRGELLDWLIWVVVALPASLVAPQFVPGAVKLVFLTLLWACLGAVIGKLAGRLVRHTRRRGSGE